MKAIQDYYPDHLNQCHGCGLLNPNGLGIKSYWLGNRQLPRYLTASLHVDYLRPTPIKEPLELVGTTKMLPVSK